jgi:hypothetical protein
MEGDVSSDYGIILESMGRVSWVTSLVTVMDAGLPKLLASSGYKSQRKRCTKKKRRENEIDRKHRERRREKKKNETVRRSREEKEEE